MFTTEKSIFYDLPKRSIIRTQKDIENFGNIIKKIYNQNTQPEFYNIAKTIYQKLDTEEPEWFWSLEDYGEFKKLFSKIAINKIDVLGTSIQKCLDAANSEIYRELQMFSQECNWYQSMITQSENIHNIPRIRGIHSTDCFWVIVALESYMNKNIRDHVNTILTEINENDSVKEIITKIENHKEQVLTSFATEFEFITKYPLFKDIYNQMYQKSLDKLIGYVFNVYGTTKMKQDYQRLDVGSATAYAKYLGKHQLNNDIKSGNKTSRYIYKY